MDVGKQIRTARNRAGITQESLATLIGVTRVTIYNWERNATSPNLRQLDLLAKALDRTLGYFTDPSQISTPTAA